MQHIIQIRTQILRSIGVITPKRRNAPIKQHIRTIYLQAQSNHIITIILKRKARKIKYVATALGVKG